MFAPKILLILAVFAALDMTIDSRGVVITLSIIAALFISGLFEKAIQALRG